MPRLTRQELYDLVWSTPMTKLAERFGISDVGLTKICDRHRVPTPPRGYWAKKEAGKKVKQTIFVQVDDPLLDRIDVASNHDRLPQAVRDVLKQRRAEKKALRSDRPATKTPPPGESMKEPHEKVAATAKALRHAKSLKSGAVEAIGPGLCGISIGVASLERTISILDRLARTCEAHGLSFSAAETRMSASIEQDSVTFEVKERTKQAPHVLTEAEIAAEEKRRRRSERWTSRRSDWDAPEIFAPFPPKLDTIRTGELSLEIHNWRHGLRGSWRDGKIQRLEDLIEDIVVGLKAHIVATRTRREEHERAEAARKELARRHALVRARREREIERKGFLSKLMRTERRVRDLRQWIEARESTAAQDPDTNRMIEWARLQLSELERTLAPTNVADHLRANKLFPEIDELYDPLGDPPPE